MTMYKVVCAAAAAALMLASCSNDWSAGLTGNGLVSPAAKSRLDASANSSSSSAGPLAQRPFAGAPDLGSLVQYGKNPVVRRSGAYTWHAAELSEDHALKSTITGDLSFTAPDGTAISLKYERHVEHPDGNWSWIGRGSDERGESTVITFGEDAAFGTIPQRDGLPLRLTVSGGRSWVVSTDPRLLREVNNEATDPTGPDYLVPPKLSAASTASGMEAMAAQTASATSSGKTVVDVLVGFTNGYSDRLGGSSAALTRVHNLVDITNQAYVNSKVEAEVRLVHAMQVGYPDATANATALEELTGFKAPSTKTTPAAAFSGLRSARDQYGADLVVLLRRFQDPENDGCGIAWLIGGGRSGIDASDEYFGYSVVSDGQDTGTDGKTYFCREETFAHELGHNMGSQHDSANAKKADGSTSYGAYTYSFGYKATATTGNFYTVMAYGDKGQTNTRVFSTPNVAICGTEKNLVCGVADTADNARSLNLAIPAIAGFRATVVQSAPPRTATNDVNGDGKSDLVWANPAAGEFSYWIVDKAAVVNYGGYATGGDYSIASTGDYNRDGRMDLILRRAGGNMVMWLGSSAGFTVVSFAPSPAGWVLACSGDIDADGATDLVWFNQSTSAVAYWKLMGSAIIDSRGFAIPPGSSILGCGDYQGDGRMDLLVGQKPGAISMWRGDGVGFSTISFVNYPGEWMLIGSGDIDGDGKSDLIWRHPVGGVAYWLLDGPTVRRSAGFALGQDYVVVGKGDYDGNGQLDLVMRALDGRMHIWFGSNGGFVGWDFVQYPGGWSGIPLS